MMDSIRKKLGPLRVVIYNLDERPGDKLFKKTGSVVVHGRMRVDGGSYEPWAPALEVEWSLGDRFCHVRSFVDGLDREATFHAALPGVAGWATLKGLPEPLLKLLRVDYGTHADDSGTCERTTGVAFHDWTLFWDVWARAGDWRATDSRWKRGSLNVLDIVFGGYKHERHLISTTKVSIPMPEKSYTGTVKLFRATWTRPRWPFAVGPKILRTERMVFDLEMDEPIPFPGKGENAWDCGQDGVHSIYGDGDIEDAIASAVKSVMRNRRRRGGSIGWVPTPEISA